MDDLVITAKEIGAFIGGKCVLLFLLAVECVGAARNWIRKKTIGFLFLLNIIRRNTSFYTDDAMIQMLVLLDAPYEDIKKHIGHDRDVDFVYYRYDDKRCISGTIYFHADKISASDGETTKVKFSNVIESIELLYSDD